MYSVHCTVFVISPIIAACPDIILRSALAQHDPKQEEEDGDDDEEDFDNDDEVIEYVKFINHCCLSFARCFVINIRLKK